MNPRLAQFLVRLYPPSWRARYGAEFLTFLESDRGGLRNSANVAWSALCERILPTPGLDQSARAVQFRSWCLRAPWAIFSLSPLLLLAGSYFIGLFLLWAGWVTYLPGADTPFGGPMRGPIYGFGNIYFQADKLFYFGAPVLIGWAIGLVAARQRVKVVWPSVGWFLIILMGATNRVHASRTAIPRGLGHISMDFALGTSVPAVWDHLFYASVILLLTVLPYLIWRLQRSRSLFA